MTGNQIKGRGFRGALRYNLEKVEKKVAEVLDHSFVSVSEKSIMKEIQMIRTLRPNLQKYFYHTSINFPPAEDISNDLMKQIGNDYMVANGFDKHQFIMFRHRDADHPHLHILVNRIGYDGKVLSDSNDFQRSEKVLRELEKKYNLTQVTPSRRTKERAMTKDEMEMMKRTKIPSGKIQLQVRIKSILTSNKKLTCSEFIQALESKGVNVKFNQASTGYVSGISYSYEGFIITGAKLGQAYKWSSIKNSINYEQERDIRTIHKANARGGHRPEGRDIKGPERGSGNVQAAAAYLREDGPRHQATGEKPRLTSLDSDENTGHGKLGTHKGKRSAKYDLSLSDFLQEGKDGINLASLLDSYSGGNISNPDHQPDLDNPHLRPKRKKKRRGRRI